MTHLDVIKKIEVEQGIKTITLDKIYPIEAVKNDHVKVHYYIDDEKQALNYDCYYANKVVIEAEKPQTIDLLIGKGYFVEEEQTLTKQFIKHNKWSGGDGIYSFNMENGKDHFDQDKTPDTLFVFGDTFVGRSNPETKERYQPHLMPNNSIAYKHGEEIQFKLNQQKNGEIKAFYEMDEAYDLEGPIPANLISYDQQKEKEPYLSGYEAKDVALIFDLFEPTYVSHMSIINYFSKEATMLSKRGAKHIHIEGSNDRIHFELIQTLELKENLKGDDITKVSIDKTYRYFKLILIDNHNDQDFQEGLVGLNQVRFYQHQDLLRDLNVSASHLLHQERSHGWIWLQDGVVIGEHLYFLPLVVNSDQSQPEGLQFRIDGVAMFKTPIEDHKIVPEKRTQKMAPLLVYDKDSSYLFGGAIMPLTKEAGAIHPDGYMYIYGYKTTLGLRQMVVARVKPEQFELMNHWTYFDGKSFVKDILKAAPILDHISCEFSVSPIHQGLYKDKYIAIFTYDVNTPYVSYAIGDTPYGPFKAPQKVYKTPEQEIFKSTTYTYNAKAHPHLSKSTKILVSYNTNTYNFDHNMSNYLIYRPRFVELNDTTV